MMGWKAFFPPSTPVQFGQDGEFVPLAEINFMSPPVPSPPPPPPPPEQVVEDANVVSNGDDALEEKIEPEAMTQLTTEDDEVKPSTSDTETARPQLPGDHEGPEVLDPEVDMCVPPPSDDEGDSADDELHGDDEDVDAKHDGPEVDLCLPPPSDDEADGDEDGQEADMCVPPPLDDNEEEGYESVSYPAVGEYPLPSDDAVPYPVDVEYPVDDDAYAYPNTSDAYGDSAPGEMAAVAPYPSADDVIFGVTNDAGDESKEPAVMPPVNEKKKEYDGDKAVVGFMPSHLRVKRKAATKSKKPPTKQAVLQSALASAADSKKAQAPEKCSNVAEDYNKFMEEISGLK